jgi:hypothetical protein
MVPDGELYPTTSPTSWKGTPYSAPLKGALIVDTASTFNVGVALPTTVVAIPQLDVTPKLLLSPLYVTCHRYVPNDVSGLVLSESASPPANVLFADVKSGEPVHVVFVGSKSSNVTVPVVWDPPLRVASACTSSPRPAVGGWDCTVKVGVISVYS